ncbi:MAG TPA: C4-dicarboxylate TRAP transporter substrate-binding protein [Desulfosporosinus sp.]|nr:C4-dicarboxylate TRAP transporter substrate-binding protein [Desulfosporosinus sp.]
MKRNGKILALLLVTFLMITTLAGCSKAAPTSATTPTAGAKHVLKLSNVFTAEQPLNITLKEVADNIKKRTNGSIEIQIYPNGEIPNSQDGVEQVVRGADLILVDSPSNMGSWVPDYDAFLGPMLYTSQEEYSKMCKTDLAKSINKMAEAKGIKVLSLDYTFGFRSLGGQTAINTPADLKGKKWRVPKSQLWIDTLTAMGSNPVPTAWSEVFSGMQSGVFDGFETSVSDMYDNKLQEVVKNVSLTRHFLGTTGVMLSTKVWGTLSPEEQKIMEEEFLAGAIKNNERMVVVEADARKGMEAAGVKFNEVDVEAFRKATAVVFTKNDKFTPGIYDKINAELKTIRGK